LILGPRNEPGLRKHSRSRTGGLGLHRGDLKKVSSRQANSIARDADYKDAEDMKRQLTGSRNTGPFDVYKDTKTGDYYILGKGGKGEPIKVDAKPTNRY
jgi:hypothetical protein